MNMLPDFVFPADYAPRSRAMLERCLRDVPAYRAWQSCDPGPASPLDERFAALPVLTKAGIRRYFPGGFVPAGTDVQRGLDTGEISFIETSGTTENRVPNIWHQAWWDASERASWQLNSVAARLATGKHAEAILANAINVGPASDEADLPFPARRLARFVFLNEKTNPANWQAPLMERMLAELAAFKPAVLEANPSLLAKLCRYAAGKARVFQPGLIVFTYERPTLLHEVQIRRVFPEVPFTSSYGATEVGYVFMQCEAGRLHQNSQYCRVDFQPLQEKHGGPLLGRILVTTFQNPWFYILRFNVGDLVRLEASGRCPCGRETGLILAGVEGRAADATLTTGGRLVTVGDLDRVLSTLTGVDEYRLEQTEPAGYALYLVAVKAKQPRLRTQATSLLKGLYGVGADIKVTFEKALAPEVSGKYRIARSLLPFRIEDYLAPIIECKER
jgi:phenylacetate-coenzyme A ligase PaaK-like adenylate-forming protein